MKKLLIVTFVSALSIVFGDDSIERQLEQMKEQKDIALSQIAKAEIRLKGKVVDQTGAPLNQVTVEIQKSILLGFLGTIRSQSETHRIDGAFDFGIKGYNTVYLTFRKDGYYSSLQSFSLRKLEEQKKGNLHAQDDLSITLIPRGEQYRNRTRFFVLVANPKGKRDLLFPVSDREQQVSFNQKTEEFPDGVFFLDFERTEQGEIVTIEQPDRVLPKTLLLCLKTKDGGLQPVPAASGALSLTEAPLDGYSTFPIRLPVDKQPKNVFFYFKIGDHYGKGQIRGISSTDNGEVAISGNYLINLESIPEKKRLLHGKF